MKNKKKYEYMIAVFRNPTWDSYEEILDRHGADGWKLVSVNISGKNFYCHLIRKVGKK